MKKIIWLLTISIVTFAVQAQPCREVVGYYAGWKWQKRNKLVNPASLIYSNYTIINYAFFKPTADGTVVEGDPYTDRMLLAGTPEFNSSTGKPEIKNSLVRNAHQNGVKVVASVGGWTWSSLFPAICAAPSKRSRFVASVLELIAKYNLDGIDIDWEYPGHEAHNGTSADKANFSLLLGELREAFNELKSRSGKQVLLTIAVGPAPKHMEQIEWETVHPLVDLIHLMSYNYYGAWDKTTNHNTPLYKPVKGNVKYNVNNSVNLLLETYGVPSSKITMGLAFYGRTATFESRDELHALSTGADVQTFPEEKGTPSYYAIASRLNQFDRYFDATAGVPYLIGKAGSKSFVSYDDPESIALKTRYAVDKDLAGVVIWEISGDYIPASGNDFVVETPLCAAIHSNICRGSQPMATVSDAEKSGLTVFPNPVFSEMEINWKSGFNPQAIEVISSSGQRMFYQEVLLGNRLVLSTDNWHSGIYLINLKSVNGTASLKVVKL